jgi:hypothetical protein
MHISNSLQRRRHHISFNAMILIQSPCFLSTAAAVAAAAVVIFTAARGIGQICALLRAKSLCHYRLVGSIEELKEHNRVWDI